MAVGVDAGVAVGMAVGMTVSMAAGMAVGLCRGMCVGVYVTWTIDACSNVHMDVYIGTCGELGTHARARRCYNRHHLVGGCTHPSCRFCAREAEDPLTLDDWHQIHGSRRYGQ